MELGNLVEQDTDLAPLSSLTPKGVELRLVEVEYQIQ